MPDLVTAIETYIDGWNDRAHPFIWTKTADEIIAKATNRKTNFKHATLVVAPVSGSVTLMV